MTTRPQNRRPVAAAGFTTIELMVAIAIILVLMGIVVFGYRRVATSSQENQTRTIMERLRNMQATITGNKAAGQKFFQSQIPYVYRHPIETGPEWPAVAAGTEDALYRTALILKALQASPEARGIFDELPTNRKRQTLFDPAQFGRIVPAGTTTPGVITVTLPLDAWDNPIVYVYDNWQIATGTTGSQIRVLAGGGETGGLTNMQSDSVKGFWRPTTPMNLLTPLSPSPYNPPTTYTANLGTALRSPDRQPFWVSAGPDGNFQTHDDNVYSFEN